MKFFALEEWAEANAAYDADTPPYWHAKIVPDAFTVLSGIFWSAAYILMATRSFQDQSYSMPIYCLCLNVAWETVFGFVYGPGLVNQIVFGQWMIVDAFLVYTTVKYGKRQWRQQPLIANHLGWIIVFGCIFCLCLHLSIAATFVPVVGRRVVPFTAWPMQLLINVGCLAQLLSRGHSEGHSWAIWWTRMIGTVAAAIALYWRGYYWPERFGYASSPYFIFLFFNTHLFDLLYPIAFFYIRKEEQKEKGEREGKGKKRKAQAGKEQ